MPYLESELETLFRETGEAHHKAFEKAEEDDAEWPLWYSEHLHAKLIDLLEVQFTRSELVYLLVMAEAERAAHAPGAPWPFYFATFFS